MWLNNAQRTILQDGGRFQRAAVTKEEFEFPLGGLKSIRAVNRVLGPVGAVAAADAVRCDFLGFLYA